MKSEIDQTNPIHHAILKQKLAQVLFTEGDVEMNHTVPQGGGSNEEEDDNGEGGDYKDDQGTIYLAANGQRYRKLRQSSVLESSEGPEKEEEEVPLYPSSHPISLANPNINPSSPSTRYRSRFPSRFCCCDFPLTISLATCLLVVMVYIILFLQPPPIEQQITLTIPSTIYIEDDYVTYPIFPSNHTGTTITDSFTLLLYGDSLIDVPSREYQLKEKMLKRIEKQIIHQQFHQKEKNSFQIQIQDSGEGGNKIQDLRNRLENDVFRRKNIDAIIVFWDSDVSDQENSYLILPSTQLAYQDNVRYVFTALLQKIPFVAMAGPELLGEQPRGKDGMLDLYRHFNQQIARELNIPYINIRKGFQELIPTHFILSPPGFLTRDGEHPNPRGTKLIAEYFSKMVLIWYFHLTMNE